MQLPIISAGYFLWFEGIDQHDLITFCFNTALLEHDDLQERYLQQQTELQELQAKLAETEASLWKLTNGNYNV